MNWPWSRKQPVQETATPPTPLGVATSLRSWEYAFAQTLGSYVPLTVDYAIYDAIREGIPFIDTAIRKLSRMVGGFKVKSDNEAAAEKVNAGLAALRVFGICSGFDTFERSYVSSLLQYGKSCAEIVLSENGRAIYELTIVPTKRVKLVVAEKGEVLLGEVGVAGLKPYDRQDLFAYTAMNVDGDNPHGTSILRSLPFVTNISLIMQNALRQRWMRHGAPSFVFFEELPETVQYNDEDIAKRQGAWSSSWQAAMKERWEQQDIRDFFAITQGSMRVETAEPRQNPEYVDPWRSLAEQIVGTTELAPFMLGLQWSTTERLSQQQADMIISLIMGIRQETETAYMHIVDWWARLNGVRAEFTADWPDVSLQDAVETARADLMQAQAAKVRLEVANGYWRNGWVDQLGAATEAGLDIEQPVVVLEAPPGIPAQQPNAQGEGEAEGEEPGNNGRGGAAFAEYAGALWEKYP